MLLRGFSLRYIAKINISEQSGCPKVDKNRVEKKRRNNKIQTTDKTPKMRGQGPHADHWLTLVWAQGSLGDAHDQRKTFNIRSKLIISQRLWAEGPANLIAPRIPLGRSAFSRSVVWRFGWSEGRLVDGSVDRLMGLCSHLFLVILMICGHLLLQFFVILGHMCNAFWLF